MSMLNITLGIYMLSASKILLIFVLAVMLVVILALILQKIIKPDNIKYETGLSRLGAAIVDALVFVPIVLVDTLVKNNLDDKLGLLAWLTFMTALSIFYSVLLHYKYGQTLGKMVANIKVVNLDETRNIKFSQALLRDSYNILMNMAALIFSFTEFIWTKYFYVDFTGTKIGQFSMVIGFSGALTWTLLELISMLTNKKRRAIHDFIAGSVVIRTSKKQ